MFRMLKFRTMVQDAIAVGQALKISEDPYGHLPDDPRITRSGRVPAADEPRRAAAARQRRPRRDEPRRPARRHRRAGRELHRGGPAPARREARASPGWAQVNGRDAIPWPQRFELDAWYIEHWSLAARREDRRARPCGELFRERPEPIVDEMNIERAKARQPVDAASGGRLRPALGRARARAQPRPLRRPGDGRRVRADRLRRPLAAPDAAHRRVARPRRAAARGAARGRARRAAGALSRARRERPRRPPPLGRGARARGSAAARTTRRSSRSCAARICCARRPSAPACRCRRRSRRTARSRSARRACARRT